MFSFGARYSTLWITFSLFLSLLPVQIHLEFVVKELRACCHHRISLECESEDFRIAIVQARYIPESPGEKEKVAASSSSDLTFTSASSQFEEEEEEDYSHHPFIHPSRPSISLWDLDIQFLHQVGSHNSPGVVHMNSLPDWYPDPESRRHRFRNNNQKKKISNPSSSGIKNYSGQRVLEVPGLYNEAFLDDQTIWNQPLFPLDSVQSEVETFVTKRSRRRGGDDDKRCLSYQTLMKGSRDDIPIAPKPNWNFRDMRPYFNKRCSGKRKSCQVLLLPPRRGGVGGQGEEEDEYGHICSLLPGGKIVVKYLCFNSLKDNSHSKCNIAVTPAKEGFVSNPLYPDLYPGDDLPCHFRLHVPNQRILLIFFDISLRGQDKGGKCKDELVVTEGEYQSLATCGDHESAIAILSSSDDLNITLYAKSRLGYPKRGFLAYYRVIGCSDPPVPPNSYLAFRNATVAELICDVGHIFPDLLSRTRSIFCSPLDRRWLGNHVPFCADIRNLMEGNSSIEELLRRDPSVWPIVQGRYNNYYFYSSRFYFTEIGLPIFAIIATLAFHGVVLYLIWRQRSRLEELENQTNQVMERLCLTSSLRAEEGGSLFSFPDSFVDDLWDQDEEDGGPKMMFEIEELTDQDHTLTTATLTLQDDSNTTPTSSILKTASSSLLFRFYQQNNPSSSTTASNSTSTTTGGDHRGHIAYVHGQLLPVTFNGYFKQTAV